MCGITGIIAKRRINLDAIYAMTKQLTHRGPDGRGFWSGENAHVCFGHRRLIIIDPTNYGSQPMVDKTGQYIISFNGAIYNYIELGRELQSKGISFKSKCDTEVLLESYKYWGIDCLERLNGMFAFAIYDKNKKSIFCARDRFGEKPFLYTKTSEYIAFASEYKSLFSLDGLDVDIDNVRLLRFLDQPKQGMDNERATVFKNVFQLLPAEFMIIDESSLEVTQKKYWDVKPSPELAKLNDKEAAERFGLLLEDSVNIRMRSDVPLGSSLSGGLDSSSIVGLNRKILGDGKAFHTFTGTFPKCDVDEDVYAKIVRDEFDLIGHIATPNRQDFIKDLEDFIWFNELPVGSASQYAQWAIFKLAKSKGVKVLLDGQGADEVLGGYEQYFGQYLDAISNFKEKSEVIKEREMIKDRYPLALPKHRYFDKLPFKYSWHLAHSFNRGSQFLYGVSLDIAQEIKKENVRQLDMNFNPLSRLLKDDALHTHLPTLLRYGDRNSMAHSIEVRLPFCDHRIAEFSLSLDPQRLMGKAETKHLLRSSMSQVLPERIKRRWNKQGFLPPQEDWFREGLINLIYEIIEQKEFAERGYWEKSWWQLLIKRFQEGEGYLASTLWKLLISELWYMYFVKRLNREPRTLVFR